MPKHTPATVGFSFQEIPLEEAVNAVLAGDGNYSQIKQTLLEKLPQLSPDKAFAFGLPDGKEVPEKNRRGLCMAINATLKRAKLNWRITYSGIRKLFICVPRTKKSAEAKPVNGHVPKSKYGPNDDIPEILKLRKEGLSVTVIAKKTKVPLERVKYLAYQVFPQQGIKLRQATKQERNQIIAKHAPNGNGGTFSAAQQLVHKARALFGYTGDFAVKDPHAKIIRKAISVVGVNDLGLDPKELAPLVGIGRSGVYFNARMAKSKRGWSEIEALQKAVKQEG